SPASLTGSGSSTLTVTTTGTAQTGAFTLTITGSSGGLNHSATVTLNVNSSGGGGGTTWTRVEQDNSAVQYIGDWATNTDPNHSGGSAKLTLVNSVTFSFSGTGARWIGYSDPWSGIANVYVDGVFQAAVDTYSNTSKYQVVQYTTTGLASGNHTLKIQATGQHSSAASSSWVWVDAFEWTSSGGTGAIRTSASASCQRRRQSFKAGPRPTWRLSPQLTDLAERLLERQRFRIGCERQLQSREH